MAPVNPLANWEKVGDSFYRKVSVYDAIFDEDVELENYLVAGAPYGGAIGRITVHHQNNETMLNTTLTKRCIVMRASRIGFAMRRQPGPVLTSTHVLAS